MSHDPSPLNPWRPPGEDDPLPRDVPDLYQPWRPAGYQPVEPVDLNRVPLRKPARPAPRLQEEFRLDQQFVVFFLLGCLLVGFLLLVWQGGSHVLRIAVTLLAGWLGLSLAVSWARGRSWYVRLGCAAVGLAGAAGAWWFLPTTGGTNLWQVHRLLHEVETLPAGSVREYRTHLDARQGARDDFPNYGGAFGEAENAWFRRTADQAIRTAMHEGERDPARALAGLRRFAKELEGLDHPFPVNLEVLEAQERLLEAHLGRAARELDALIAKGKYREVPRKVREIVAEGEAEAGELGTLPNVMNALRRYRRRAVEGRLEEARLEVHTLLREDQFHAVGQKGKQVAEELAEEAREAGLAEEVAKFQASCEAFALLAEQAEDKEKR